MATAAATGQPALAYPSRIAECRRCPWDTVCTAEMVASKDISLVAPGIDAVVLRAGGLFTIDDLADSDPAYVQSLPLTALRRDEAVIRARAWQHSVSLVRRRDDVVVRRADIELDVDMESYVEDGAYLWGTLLSGSVAGMEAIAREGFSQGYLAFATWEMVPTPDEGRAFAQFWQHLTALRELAASNGLTFAAYCYSRAAEERWLKSTPVRYPDVSGMPGSASIAEFIATADWVDLYAVIGAEFLVPGSRRLKALAPIAGFHWRDPEASGENSMAWYRSAVGADGHPPDPALKDRLLQYNEDDVLATHALRNWMSGAAGEQTPTIAQLMR
ncbi:TM0106 family RecB-like putative nuclease [Nakamurella antarctica]|uniref:TM0106 family RecB-like putative nuclease n=1 Tax=Nakamurella antarctica TaxID=1902245 RepID=UPI001EF00F08|nr:TM0106 family RecB-like putative nuclease [Nakamurella antarctica]